MAGEQVGHPDQPQLPSDVQPGPPDHQDRADHGDRHQVGPGQREHRGARRDHRHKPGPPHHRRDDQRLDLRGCDRVQHARDRVVGQNPKTFPLTSIPPESSITLVHEIEVANGAANVYSDKATAKYTDHAYPDIEIPGQTEATAQANVVVNTSTANASVTVTDLESISGNPDVEYRIDGGSATGTYKYNDGAKEAYTPGTSGFTTRPILWTSGSVSSSQTFTFNKTVRVAKPTSGDATLADIAEILGDQGASLGTASASVDISSSLDCPDVTVSKTADDKTIDAGDTAAFTIVVTNNGPAVAKDVTLSDTLAGRHRLERGQPHSARSPLVFCPAPSVTSPRALPGPSMSPVSPMARTAECCATRPRCAPPTSQRRTKRTTPRRPRSRWTART